MLGPIDGRGAGPVSKEVVTPYDKTTRSVMSKRGEIDECSTCTECGKPAEQTILRRGGVEPHPPLVLVRPPVWEWRLVPEMSRAKSIANIAAGIEGILDRPIL